ncbi:hypothetical protein MKZ38_010604 [Zalerion maritima]|uniref:Uncharacterized protein n=1 Tax=Zalerion maritima TaxID=339359 RepID=A0AAD5RTG7_9PEZI|nr:hypothetical protein MKZ38_010604 [Zalerion maritima]
MEGFDMKIGIPYNQQGPDFHRYLFVAAFKHVEHWVERAKVVGILKQQEIPTPPRILISWRGRSSQRDTEPRFMVNFDVKTDVPSSDIKLRQSCIHLVLLCITGNLPGTTFLPGAFWRVAVSIVQRCGEKSLAEEHDLISKVNEISEAMELSRRLT